MEKVDGPATVLLQRLAKKNEKQRAATAGEDSEHADSFRVPCTCRDFRESRTWANHIPVRCGRCRAIIGEAMPTSLYGDYRSWRSPQMPPRLSSYMKEALTAQAEPSLRRASIGVSALLLQRLRYRELSTKPIPRQPPILPTEAVTLEMASERALINLRPRLAHLRFLAMREADELPLRDPIGMLGDMLREARMRTVEQKRKEEQTRESEEADRLLQAAGFGDIFLMQHDKEALCMADEAAKLNSIAAAS